MSKKKRTRLPATPVTADITRLSHEGRGITEVEGKSVFVTGALPGESVSFLYKRKHSQFDEGDVVSVITASPDRVPAPCDHFAVCGGCTLQHLDTDKQVEHKEAALLSLLHQTPPQTVIPPLHGPTTGYRRKARLGVKYVEKKGAVLVGFRERRSPYITNMSSCQTLHPEVGLAIEALSALIFRLSIRSAIPQLEFAMGDTEIAIILRHLAPIPPEDLQQIITFFRERRWHLFLQPKGVDSIHRVEPPSDGHDLLCYTLPAEQLTMHFHPSQFTQINHEINQKMVAQALSLLALNPADKVLDLFCGIGNFTLPISAHVTRVVGVEGDPSAIAMARHNAALNHRDNCDFAVANLFEDCSTSAWANSTYDKVLIDPPRSGAKEIIPLLKTWQPSHVVYISCNPATLARDAMIMRELGYNLECAGVMDMFPHTQHTEAMALFRR